MEECFSLSFYTKNDYEKRIGEIAQAEYGNGVLPEDMLGRMLDLDDPIISFYLLVRLRERLCTIGDSLLVKLTAFIKRFRRVVRYRVQDFDREVARVVFSKIRTDIEISTLIECASLLDIGDAEFDWVKRNFGYGEIYRYSKEVIGSVLEKKHNEREIGYALVLLNHPALCYKSLLPLFQRINLYVDSALIDKNILEVCAALRAVLVYSPQTLEKSEDFVLSVLVFLVKMLHSPDLYTHIGCNDLQELLQTVEVLLNVSKGTKRTHDLSVGIFDEARMKMMRTTEQKTSVLDDCLLVYAMLGTCRIFYRVIMEKKESLRLFEGLYAYISTMVIEKPSYISRASWHELGDLFLREKYCFLEAISKEDPGFSLDTHVVAQDIERCDDPTLLLREMDTLCRHVDWNILGPVLCDPRHQSGCADFVFSDKLAHKEHVMYMLSYFSACLKTGNVDTLLFATRRVCETAVAIPDFVPLFAQIFAQNDLCASDQRTVKIKRCILTAVFNKDCAPEFLREVLGRSRGGGLNFHLLSFMVICCFKLRDVPGDIVVGCFGVISSKARFREWSCEARKDTKLVTYCVSLGIVLSKHRGARFRFLRECNDIPSFYRYVIFIVSFLERRDHADENLEFEQSMLEFLFSSSNIERSELEKLYFCAKRAPRHPAGDSAFVAAYTSMFGAVEQHNKNAS